MNCIRTAILLGILLTGARAWADYKGIVEPNEQLINNAVSGVVNATRNTATPIEAVKDLGDRAFGQPNAVKIRVQPDLRGWDFLPKAPSGDLTIANAMADARQRLFDKNVSLSGPLDGAISSGELLEGNSRSHFAEKGQMPPYEAGIYFYNDGDPDMGRILLNYNILEMAADADKEKDPDMRETERLAAWIAAEATYIHESAHALAKAHNLLHPTKVIDGEDFAFSMEKEFLDDIDPHGEGVATLIMVAQLHMKYHPSDTATLCYQLSSMLGNLHRIDKKNGTGERIEATIVRPNYSEKQSVL